LKSSLRKSPIAADGDDYLRKGADDDRFVDYPGPVQSIVTSAANNDSGLFEPGNLERFLPFEGAGAECTLRLDIPTNYPAFDYSTISDVILHIRYTARQGVERTKVTAALGEVFKQANQSGLALLFVLRHDFPTEWSAFVNGADFTVTLRQDHFPYMVQSAKQVTVDALTLYAAADGKVVTVTPQNVGPALPVTFSGAGWTTKLSLPIDGTVMKPDPSQVVFLILRYHLGP